jgi:tetratricopeptide (TPR) repeat protein
MQGMRDGSWPLRARDLQVAAYVAHRLRARGQIAAREAWVDLASAALEAAAVRKECPHQARTARFGLLVATARWQDAYEALRQLREDRGDADGALLVAEASLLAGGLGREREALGILDRLDAETSPFDAQHRVAGWLLLGEIRYRAGNWDEAQRAYERAGSTARSESGRSEAALGLARVQAARGDLDAARRLYARLRAEYTGTPAGLVAPLEEVRLLRDRGLEGEAQALLPAAMQSYRAVLQGYGTEMPAFVAAQHLSECMSIAGDWRRGVSFLDSIAVAFGNDPRAGSLLVRAARLAIRERDPRRAEALLASLHARYPESDVAVLARAFEDSLGIHPPTP